jgi:hypothetical protein
MNAPAENATDLLLALAAKYIWWCSAEEAVQSPPRVVAQVMTIGDYDDALLLARELGEDYLREVLAHAQPGQFDPRSWAYWHYRLGLEPPDRPVRRFE